MLLEIEMTFQLQESIFTKSYNIADYNFTLEIIYMAQVVK